VIFLVRKEGSCLLEDREGFSDKERCFFGVQYSEQYSILNTVSSLFCLLTTELKKATFHLAGGRGGESEP
jgi:hypothetical protein